MGFFYAKRSEKFVNCNVMNEERERGVCHFTVHTDLMGSGTHFLCLKRPVWLESKCDFPSNVNRAEEF